MFATNGFLTGLGIGAACMYFFDPDLGRRRRALCLDQSGRALRDFEHAADVTWRDLNNRTMGLAAWLAPAHERDDSDAVLVNRVRSKMGHYVSHPSAIQVHAQEGRVRLSGPVLAHEIARLFAAVRSVPGVAHVENNLDAHQSPEGVAALQGCRRSAGAPRDFFEQNWSPTARLAAGVATALALGTLASTRTSGPLLLGVVGLGLLGLSKNANCQRRQSHSPDAGQPESDIPEPATIIF
jgi:hypothetical protein